MMVYEDFNINDLIGSQRLLEKLVNDIKDIDIITDGFTEVTITSKFPNIFYYKMVSNDMLIKRKSKTLEEYHITDSYKEIRLLDFIKNVDGEISGSYNLYYREFLTDALSIFYAYSNSISYPQWSYNEFRSKLFKQYIINVVYICIDIYTKVKY